MGDKLKDLLEKSNHNLYDKKYIFVLLSQLKENTLTIDREGYFQVNGLRLWTIVWKDHEGPLLAEKLRSDKPLSLDELKGRISIIDPDDPAPQPHLGRVA